VRFYIVFKFRESVREELFRSRTKVDRVHLSAKRQ